MARTMKTYRVWFQTAEGERYYQEVEAMNVHSAVNKAKLANALDTETSSDKRTWAAAFAQEMSPTAGEGYPVYMLQEENPIPLGSMPLAVAKPAPPPPKSPSRIPGRTRKKVETEEPSTH